VRVRVKFRYNAETGEVEVFQVNDLHSGPRLTDHDARHDRATADVARVVEANALIEEMPPGVEMPTVWTVPVTDDDERDHRPERHTDG